MNIKVWLYPCSLHLHYKRDPCTQLFPSQFCRIFKNTFLLEHFWASPCDFIFDIFKSNKYMNVSFLLIVFHRKSKTKQKSRVALRLGKISWELTEKNIILRKLSKDFQENILGGVILVHNRYFEQLVCNLTKRRTLPPVFSGKTIENGWLWTAASEQYTYKRRRRSC